MEQILTAPASLPGRNDPCWCGSGKKYKRCHAGHDAVPVAPRTRGVEPTGIRIKTPEQIEGIRRACQLTREILDQLPSIIAPGVTTDAIDKWIHTYTRDHGAVPATLGYRGYTRSCCTSINEVVCHGIPSADRILRDGDILNVDVTSLLDGYYGDACRMYPVGTISPQAEQLVRVTRECLERAIGAVRAGAHLGDIGAAIQSHAESHGYSVVRDFVGHGVGVAFHEEPQVPHFGKRGTGIELRENMIFTIEPMINEGTWKTRVLEDGWTAVTTDGKLSAQWEHTVRVLGDGAEVMTA